MSESISWCPTAHVLVLLALVTPISRGATTCTGTELAIVEPFPSWPELLPPQQNAFVFEPQLWFFPATAPNSPGPSPVATATGMVLPVVVPLPSWPKVLSPQQYILPP